MSQRFSSETARQRGGERTIDIIPFSFIFLPRNLPSRRLQLCLRTFCNPLAVFNRVCTLPRRVVYVRGGADDPRPFDELLLEEYDVEGCDGMGFVGFLQQVETQARQFMHEA